MDTGVSFIIIPAKKGTQAASVTIADPPKENPVPTHETTDFGGDGAWGAWGEAVEEENSPTDKPTNDTADGAWGDAVEEEKSPTDKPTTDTADGAWGEAVEEEKASTDKPTTDTADGAWGEPVTEEEATPGKDNETPPEKAMQELHLTDTNEQSTAAADGEW